MKGIEKFLVLIGGAILLGLIVILVVVLSGVFLFFTAVNTIKSSYIDLTTAINFEIGELLSKISKDPNKNYTICEGAMIKINGINIDKIRERVYENDLNISNIKIDSNIFDKKQGPFLIIKHKYLKRSVTVCSHYNANTKEIIINVKD